MSLATTAARGGLIILISQVVKVFLQLISIILLARIISPESFGLVAMVVSVFGAGEVLRDFGLSAASIQTHSLSQNQASNLFWCNGLLGLILACLAYFSATTISYFFQRNELIEISQLLSVIFIVNGFATQFKAKLNRELKFKQLAIAELSGIGIGLSVGIYLACKGYSYWALVFQQVIQASIFLISYIMFTKWLPSLPSRNSGTKQLLLYGFNLMGAQLLGYFSKNIPQLLIGYRYGAASLGFFEKAMQILMLPLNQLSTPTTTIALPILSRLENVDAKKYNRFLLFGQNILVHIVVFTLSLVIGQTERLIIIVFGEPWLNIVPIFQALSLGGIFLALSYSSYWVFLSKGLTDKLFKLNLICRPLIVIVSALGLFWGPSFVALFYSLSLMLTWLLELYWLRNTGIPVIKMTLNPLSISLIYLLSAYLASGIVGATDLELYTGLITAWAVNLIFLVASYICFPFFRNSVNMLIATRKYFKNYKNND